MRLSIRSILAVCALGLFIAPAAGRFAGGATLGALFTALPLFALVYAQIVLINTGRVHVPSVTTRVVPIALWTALLLVSLARSNNPSHSGSGLLLLLLMWSGLLGSIILAAAELSTYSVRVRETIRIAVSLALPVYVLLNVVLFAIGVENPQPMSVNFPEGSLGALLGVRIERTLFPLAKSIQNFGVLSGLSLCVSLNVLLAERTRPWLRFASMNLCAFSVTALILADSRGPLLFGCIAGISVPLLQRLRLGKLVRLIVPVAPLLPALLLIGLTTIARTPFGQSVSRQPGDISSATGRAFIWGVATAKLIQNPSLQDIVGYGQYGAKGAGVSQAWASLFKGFLEDATLTSTHNLALQLIYDTGFLGLAIVLWLLWWALGRLHRDRTADNAVSTTAFSGIIFYLVIAGTTEATVSIGYSEPLILISLILATLAFSGRVNVSTLSEAPGRPARQEPTVPRDSALRDVAAPQ